MLIELAYRKSYLYRFIREPLKLIMRLWVRMKGIEIQEYEIHHETCTNCIRFYKNALKDQSPLFCRLNHTINPLFDLWLEKIVGLSEINRAKEHARAISNNQKFPEDRSIPGNPGKWSKL